MNNLIKADVENSQYAMPKRFFQYLTDSLNDKGYLVVDDFFFWKIKDWKIKTQKLQMPLMNYYLTSYVAIDKYFKNVDVVENQNILLENTQTYVDFIQEFNIESQHEAGRIYDRMILYLILNFTFKLLILVSAICVIFPLTFIASQKAYQLLKMLTKISTKDINFYIGHFSKMTQAFKGDSESVENLLKMAQANYMHGLKEKNRGTVSKNQYTRITKGIDNKKIDWVIRAIFLSIFMVTILGGKAIMLEHTSNELISQLKYINKLPVLTSEMYSASSYSLKLMGLKISGQTTTTDYKNSIKEFKEITESFKYNLDELIRSKNKVLDPEYRAELDLILKSDLCSTTFDKEMLLIDCVTIVRNYIENGFWSMAPMYNTGFWKYKYYLDRVSDGPELRSFMNSDIVRDLMVSGYWFEKINSKWGEAIRSQFERESNTDATIILVLTIVEIGGLCFILLVAVGSVFPRLKKNSIFSFRFLL
jgi:hypothetical protein